MNHTVTSKQSLLKVAKDITYSEGLNHLNIRRVALACNISIGAVYNYFPSKSDLVFALVEDFWSSIISESLFKNTTHIGFPDYFEQLYQNLYLRLKEFKVEFLQQIMQFNHAEKEKGKSIEKKYFQYIKNELLNALQQDQRISPLLWNDSFTKDAFIDFVFKSMISSLKHGENNSVFFKEMIIRLLY
ncbi:MAG: TetR/AcrR family transcriptional regulator [Anaerovorax sp.]|nr:TetR/AcrR family transcriptional regulator [Anaerovorax sp.]